MMMMMMMMLVLLVMVMSREDVRTGRVSWGVGKRGKNRSTSDRLVFFISRCPVLCSRSRIFFVLFAN